MPYPPDQFDDQVDHEEHAAVDRMVADERASEERSDEPVSTTTGLGQTSRLVKGRLACDTWADLRLDDVPGEFTTEEAHAYIEGARAAARAIAKLLTP